MQGVHDYLVWLTLPTGEQVSIGALQLVTETKQKQRRVIDSGVQYAYLPDYLSDSEAYDLDPENLELREAAYVDLLALPGVFEDTLPDRWGRLVANRLRNIDVGDTVALIDDLSGSQIGCLSYSPDDGEPPKRNLGHPLAWLEQMEQESAKFETDADPEILSELKIAINTGSKVGGMRRKLLIHDGPQGYLAKFQQKNDTFNLVRVEHACLAMARELGIAAADSLVCHLSQRDALLVTRFDVNTQGVPCRQLLSMRSILNDDEGRYDDLVEVVRKHVSPNHVAEDLARLFGQMCLNICLSNTDDHLKNFALLYDPDQGWRLSPAYDIVPTDVTGTYHTLSFGYSSVPPQGDALINYGHKVFGLAKRQATDIIDRCAELIDQWPAFFQEQGVSEADVSYLSKIIRNRLNDK